MENRQIKFNHNYKKLHNQKWCFIKDVIMVYGYELTDNFRKYDTDDEYQIEDKQKYMLLFCMGDEFIPFTTLRKFNEENIMKYCNPETNAYEFMIVVEEHK